jgi:hypothetical protein
MTASSPSIEACKKEDILNLMSNDGNQDMKHAVYPVLLVALLLYACSGEDEETGKGHVWKDQTDMMEKAKKVEGIVQESAERQRDQIEDQVR